MQEELTNLRKTKKTLENSNSELKVTLRSRERQLAKLEREYNDLKSGSSNYIETKQLKDQLEVENKRLKNQLVTLLEKNKELERKKRQFVVCKRSWGLAGRLAFGFNYGSSPDSPQALFTLSKCLIKLLFLLANVQKIHQKSRIYH